MERISEKDVKELLEGSNYYVATYSPGDGITRYRFFEITKNEKPSTYFGPRNGTYTALGSKEAYVYARGLLRGGDDD